MKAILFAAGRGERMRPLTDHTPKPLLLAGGKPLIVWHIEKLVAAGVNAIVINTAHLGQKMVAQLGDGKQFGAEISYSREELSSIGAALETAGGIRYALPLLDEDAFIAISADVFTDFDYGPFVNIAKSLGHGQAYTVLVPNPEHHPMGDFSINERSKEVTDKTNEGPSFTFSGIAAYHPSLFKDLPSPSVSKLAPLLREAMLRKKVHGEVFSGLWFDIGTPTRLDELNHLLNHLLPQLGKKSPNN
jgi:N-acetyl-alpha-D-muramate 1-phosphate uridylyltransferase